MIERGQPWAAYRLHGRAVRVQFIDPVTAFEVEPQIVRTVGPFAALVMADPGRVLAACLDGISGESPAEIAALASGRLHALGSAMVNITAATGFVMSLFERLVFGRVTIDGKGALDWTDLDALGVSPRLRWSLLGLVIAQTFKPLWARSPYDPGAPRDKGPGVKAPKMPIAALWASALAREGYASSSAEVLNTWTPEQLLDAVDAAAWAAESARRTNEAAKGGK